jgi:hypothetical protein
VETFDPLTFAIEALKQPGQQVRARRKEVKDSWEAASSRTAFRLCLCLAQVNHDFISGKVALVRDIESK